MASPLGLAIIITLVSYCLPTNIYWNRDPSASPHIERIRFGWTERRSDDVTDINLDGWEMYSTGLADGKFWCLQTLFFDGDGGRHSDAECNAFENAHDPFIHTFLGIEIYRRWHNGITTAGFICPMRLLLLLLTIRIPCSISQLLIIQKISNRLLPKLQLRHSCHPHPLPRMRNRPLQTNQTLIV